MQLPSLSLQGHSGDGRNKFHMPFLPLDALICSYFDFPFHMLKSFTCLLPLSLLQFSALLEVKSLQLSLLKFCEASIVWLGPHAMHSILFDDCRPTDRVGTFCGLAGS